MVAILVVPVCIVVKSVRSRLVVLVGYHYINSVVVLV